MNRNIIFVSLLLVALPLMLFSANDIRISKDVAANSNWLFCRILPEVKGEIFVTTDRQLWCFNGNKQLKNLSKNFILKIACPLRRIIAMGAGLIAVDKHTWGVLVFPQGDDPKQMQIQYQPIAKLPFSGCHTDVIDGVLIFTGKNGDNYEVLIFFPAQKKSPGQYLRLFSSKIPINAACVTENYLYVAISRQIYRIQLAQNTSSDPELFSVANTEIRSIVPDENRLGLYYTTDQQVVWCYQSSRITLAEMTFPTVTLYGGKLYLISSGDRSIAMTKNLCRQLRRSLKKFPLLFFLLPSRGSGSEAVTGPNKSE